MEQRTKINFEEGQQDVLITREFDLPLDLLFNAYVEPALVEQWMGTKVLKLESRPHGSWQFETVDGQGKVVFRANGVIHEFVPNQKITRTFQMENTSGSAVQFPVQLEFLEFESLSNHTSKLRMQIVYRSVAFRNQMMQLPFAKGINWAHDRLQALRKLN